MAMKVLFTAKQNLVLWLSFLLFLMKLFVFLGVDTSFDFIC